MEYGREHGPRPNPSQHPHEEKKEGDGEDRLSRHVQSVPERAVRHFVTLIVTHGFRERAAGTNPSAVCAFAPAPDDRRDDDERLDKSDDEPPGERRVSEDV